MVVTKEFIWYKGDSVCHLTDEKNMSGILDKGLIPLNGERCKRAKDNRKVVFFLVGLHYVKDWDFLLDMNYKSKIIKI
jgi:hypothetical protein